MEHNKENGFALGADIGGSHITAGLVDIARKHLLEHSISRHAINPNAAVGELISGWTECITKAIGDRSIDKICLAMPGPCDYEEGTCLIRDQNKYPGLYGVNIRQRLSDMLGLDMSDVYMHNDAACFLHGEVFSANISGLNKAIGLTLGTGLGTAVYRDGISESADLWNMPFRNGIAEDYISAKWFIKKYYELSGKTMEGVKELVNHAHIDEKIRKLFEEFGFNLAEFINRFIESYNAEAVVIGGNIAHAFPFFGPIVIKQVQLQNPKARIFKSAQGENAALIGAVGSWNNANKRSLAD